MSIYKNSKISVRQFCILIMIGTVGDSILVMPTITAVSSKQDAWLSMLLAFIGGLITGGLFAAIANKLQRVSLYEAIRQRLGVWFGGFFFLLFLFASFMCCLTLLSEMIQFMTTQLMPETPVTAIIIFFAAVIIIAYRYGIESYARMGELLFPVFMGLFVMLVVFLLPQVDWPNVQPIMAKGFFSIISGAYPAYCTGFVEMAVLLMLVPYVTGKGKLTKPILTGFTVGGMVLFLVVLLSVLVLGPSLMETKYYPTFVLAQKIMIGHFFERIEAVMAFLWVITVFYKTLLHFFTITTGLAQVFQLKESKMLTIPLGMILLVGTVVGTPNIVVYNVILIEYYPWFDITFFLALPIVFLILLLAIKKKQQKTQQPPQQQPQQPQQN
ncbi:endospore germination permease [Paenibacillus glycanilyticus]|uniref:GerAB/ArcD/ProY family transporter n=1 Tax=Paenibacillus glycanilyticus TaxID=126569 RepID=UPI00203FBCEC|nr:endospore germination permease [Paenibacillus glycanilyticus]MCM3630600.1 endospore germination permease [Paenibacillus glycanilyticus]